MYRLVYADAGGRFYDHPAISAVGRSGDRFVEITPSDMMPLPRGASLVLIPGGSPVGLDRRGKFVLVKEVEGTPVFAVAALLPQGYTRTLLPAYRRPAGEKPLPRFGYTAVAWHKDGLWVAARQTDNPYRWDPGHYNTPELGRLISEHLARHPGNPVLTRLARCAREYSCFTAQNIFYRRWEGGVPVSPHCNAGCLGCISRQPAGCCPSPQDRIPSTPPLEAVVEVMEEHLGSAPGAIISFGQGCEGEPLLAAGTIAAAVSRVRRVVSRGTVNVNTNAGHTAGMVQIIDSGVDSIRVSLISARPAIYRAYHRPRNYDLRDVRRSIVLAREAGVFVSLNLLVLPGLTDREEEIKSLLAFIQETGVQMVQLRNLNIDPDYLFSRLPPARGELAGIGGLISRLEKVPGLLVGNFTREV
ncbi:radical SAM protein [Desulfofundulus sp.]|uniref:radical SAM protein n=1 Tax=Desulfofundulus sp. TaxID=2282750 RepID=UPI003C795DDB